MISDAKIIIFLQFQNYLLRNLQAKEAELQKFLQPEGNKRPTEKIWVE